MFLTTLQSTDISRTKRHCLKSSLTILTKICFNSEIQVITEQLCLAFIFNIMNACCAAIIVIKIVLEEWLKVKYYLIVNVVFSPGLNYFTGIIAFPEF